MEYVHCAISEWTSRTSMSFSQFYAETCTIIVPAFHLDIMETPWRVHGCRYSIPCSCTQTEQVVPCLLSGNMYNAIHSIVCWRSPWTSRDQSACPRQCPERMTKLPSPHNHTLTCSSTFRPPDSRLRTLIYIRIVVEKGSIIMYVLHCMFACLLYMSYSCGASSSFISASNFIMYAFLRSKLWLTVIVPEQCPWYVAAYLLVQKRHAELSWEGPCNQFVIMCKSCTVTFVLNCCWLRITLVGAPIAK